MRRAAQREGRTVSILQDLQGPKIRTGQLEEHKPVLLKTGAVVAITPDDRAGNATRIRTTFPHLARELSPGARILLSDGLIELKVRSVRGKQVLCEVLNGGTYRAKARALQSNFVQYSALDRTTRYVESFLGCEETLQATYEHSNT